MTMDAPLEQTRSDQAEKIGPALDSHMHAVLLTTARNRLRRLPIEQALQPAQVVAEAYLRLNGKRALSTRNKAYCFAAFAAQMRYFILDELRRYRSQKHGGGIAHIPLDEALFGEAPPRTAILDVNSALDQLQSADRELYDIVMFRFFAGISEDEVAECLEIPLSRVKSGWKAAKAWLILKLVDHS